MKLEKFPPDRSELSSESDVEQKILYPLFVKAVPDGMGIPGHLIHTKPHIRDFSIDKGVKKKRYHPDYVIIIAGLPLLIAEAKTPGDSLVEAARECRLYASEFNAQYPTGRNPCRFCLVSNGERTELRRWDSDEALASFDLEQLTPTSPSFSEFIRIASYEAMRKVAETALKETNVSKLHRAINKVGGHSFQDDQISYNSFGKILASEFQELFNPSTYDDRKKIAQNAYVNSKNRERYIGEIDRLIRLSCPPSVRPLPEVNDTSNSEQILSRLASPKSLQKKIMLLVGDVGAGKSTFVDYLQHVACSEEIKDRTAWTRIDLNEAPVNTEEIYNWCRKNLIDEIRSTSPDLDTRTLEGLKLLYRDEIKDFDAAEGALFDENSEEYRKRLAELIQQCKADQDLTLQCLERYLCTGRGRLLVVVLDNCDKRNRDEQLLMFEVARWIQSEVRCLVILPIRHATFEHHRNEPPLDAALKDLIYRIEPPGFQRVLKERLKLVLKDAEAKDWPKVLPYDMGGMNIEFSSKNLERFLNTVMNSLFKHEKHGRHIIFGLAGWNLRKGFEIFLEFCRSGYIDEKEIFTSQATGDDIHFGKGVVSRVLFRTNRRYYNGDKSYVKNIFQVDRDDAQPNHFVRGRILAWLNSRFRKKGPSGNQGYFPVAHISSDLSLLGLDESVVERECSYLLRSSCLIAEHLRHDRLLPEDSIAITPAGHVHLTLLRDFNYLAACAEDTWIRDSQLCSAIHKRIVKEPRHMAYRWPVILETAKEFLSYLEESHARSMPASEIVASSVSDPLEVNYHKMNEEIDRALSAFRDTRRHRGKRD